MLVSSALHNCAFTAQIRLACEADTQKFAASIADLVGAGDVLLLEGDLGAGKTAFARALISKRLELVNAPAEDIPSPTFTLVQTYVAGELEIWHADLYRLTAPSEAFELGLEEAYSSALCLIEWPSRLEDTAPAQALMLEFAMVEGQGGRFLSIGGSEAWQQRLLPLLKDWNA